MALLLVALNPIMLSTLGTGTSWTVALLVLAMLSTVRSRWLHQIVTLALLLMLHFQISTIVLASILLGVRLQRQRRVPRWSLLMLVVVALAYTVVAVWRSHYPLAGWVLDLATQRYHFDRLIAESEFYWIFFPAIGLGLPFLARLGKWLWGVLLWVLVTWLFDGLTGCAILSVGALIMAGVGADWLTSWIKRSVWTSLEPLALSWGCALILGAPLLAAEVSSLWGRFQMRPRAYQVIESVAADWLNEHSEPDQLLLSSARLGFLAERSVIPWQEGQMNEMYLPDLISFLSQSPPAYVVSARTMAWEQLTGIPWFQERYYPVREFSSASSPLSPLIVWKLLPSPYELGELRSTFVETPFGTNLIGYRMWPPEIEPGDALHVSLHWQVTKRLAEPFNAVVRIISPLDGVAWAQRDETMPRSIPADWWSPDQVIEERMALATSTEIPVGAYQVNISFRRHWPVELVSVFQDRDVNPVDRVLLGYVAVPAKEAALPQTAVPVGAVFGEQITLVGVAFDGDAMPGGQIVVTFYWEALRPPDNDFTVFVHLIDGQGAMLSGHDGRPMMGRYTTLAWQPGHLVPDEHRISVPATSPAADRQLRVGLYIADTGDRLPVLDNQWGVPAGDMIILPIE
jgi:hypothetical protein